MIEKKIERLAHYLQLSNGFDGVLQWILDLRQDMGIEQGLNEIGIDDTHLKRIAMMATEDAAAMGNPILFSALQYEHILQAAL